VILVVLIPACARPARAADLHFRSGFEAQTHITGESASSVDIQGVDGSVAPPNDWVGDLEADPIGTFTVQYQGGDTTQRYARVIDDPTAPGNRVLQYWLKHVNVDPGASYGGKGRIQANLYRNTGLREVYYAFRMYLPSDWNHLRSWTEPMGWLIIAEFWNNAAWYEEYGFRIHITIGKDAGSGSPLRFGVGGQRDEQGKWQGIWHHGSSFSIPTEEWLSCEVYFKEGDAATGRFHFAVTRESGGRTVIFDVRDVTHHPDDPSPDGLTDFNPLKLYSQKDNIDRVRDQGAVLQVYWDDFELWLNREPPADAMPPTRDDLDAQVRDRRDGTGGPDDAAVGLEVKGYREQ
jgi:hypothetical protein